MGPDGDSVLEEMIEDKKSLSPMKGITDADIEQEATALLGGLPDFEREVLRLRFGIGHDREHTLQEIGKKFDLTRERIRQIELKALAVLRDPKHSERLRCLLPN